MIVITGADYRFASLLQTWESALQKLGYQYAIYNLGGLDHGIKGFEVTDSNFQTMGYYNSIGGKWKSTGLWKPGVIKHALETLGDNILYLDCDAIIHQALDIRWPEFDVGVCHREPNPDRDPVKVLLRGDFNAGVLLFANNKLTMEIINLWIEEMAKEKNDQLALSNVLRRKACRVRWYPSSWNRNTSDAVIRHYAGNRKGNTKVRRDIL
jgi:hypothetical protein